MAEGQPQRELLGGRWHFRPDLLNVGIDYGFMHLRSLRGWLPVTVPHDFNAAERVSNRSSVGWYRRDIKVGKLAPDEQRIVRFEGAGHFSTVYLNGRIVAKHAGGYLPFEAPADGPAPRHQPAGGARVLDAGQDRPQPLAPGQLQRLRQRGLVELRRHPPRGVDPARAGHRHRAGAGAAPAGLPHVPGRRPGPRHACAT